MSLRPFAIAAALFALNAFTASAQPATPAPPCRAAQLQAIDAGAKEHGSRRVTTIRIVNTSATACRLIGYPGLEMMHADGAQAPFVMTNVQSEQNYSVRHAGPVQLNPHGSAIFYLGYPSKDQHGSPCTPVSMILISVSPNTPPLRVPDTLAPCGVLNVSPYSAAPK